MRSKAALFLVLLMAFASAQTTLKSDYVCTYKLDYTVGSRTQTEQFILFMDAKDKASFFESSINYAKDTLRARDPETLQAYESDFNEKITYTGGHFHTFERVKDILLATDEEDSLRWNILPDTKTEEGLRMQLAKTNAYGRVWYAWFSQDLPVAFGPYKFRDLPGMIVSLYDGGRTLAFSMQKFKKKSKTVRLPDIKAYRVVPFKDLNATRLRIQSADDGSVLFDSAKEREEWFTKVKQGYQSIPLLDSRFL